MNGITAQVSLYPLGQAALTPTIDDALRILREFGLNVEVGEMSSLIAGFSKGFIMMKRRT